MRLLRIEDWTEIQGSHGYTFVASLTCMGRVFKGSGHAHFPAVAIQKSIAEAYERCLFHLNRYFHGATNSNGFAAHPNLEKAVLIAASEAAERDTVLRHCSDEIPFIKVNLDTLPSELRALRHLPHNYLVTQVLIGSAGQISTMSLLAESLLLPGRALIAHGSGRSPHDGFLRAYGELARSVACSDLLPFLSQSKESGDEIFKHITALWGKSSADIQWMSGDTKTWQQAKNIWRAPAPSLASDMRVQILARGDLHVVRVESEKLLKLEFGENLNSKFRRHFVA